MDTDESWDIMSGNAIETLNTIKATKQKVHIELDVFNMDDTHAIQNAIKNAGYVRTGFKFTSNEHIKMDFEKG